MKELYLEFKLNGVNVEISREDGILTFEGIKNDESVILNVEELIKQQMYKFKVFNDICIIGFDEEDNICLHIIKENKKEHIYYSLSEDDQNMYTLEEIKRIYRYRCETKIQEISDNFETLIKDISEMHIFKNILFNKIKNKLYKKIDIIMSIYRIELHESQYIQDIKNANELAIDSVEKTERELINELKEVINKSKTR